MLETVDDENDQNVADDSQEEDQNVEDEQGDAGRILGPVEQQHEHVLVFFRAERGVVEQDAPVVQQLARQHDRVRR